ncbi:primosomal protein DnaI [Lederbergia lenta]|uniref:Primosomal DnaI domain-containing protein n=1 Tax=Lederbergia lenta TaxID=1467 RepID=A0A2X4VRZ1_LEDLE|nr:primosomal protein DnaI [Lederbergia lenta]MCM3111143.1 primosomal protein DnaI [Lederbergia lenta]MEC2325469.1 primosomal protein DnaI [Lederbergia lenta]SQI54987.1 Primosomal DnaI domain-containing protein [Lederbergia lenta]
MERINKTLNKLSGSSTFRQNYERLKSEVLSNLEVQAFIKENQEEITNSIIEKNMMKLYEYTTQTKKCADCPNLNGCVNMMQGYEPVLVLNKEMVEVHYRPCPTKITHDERRKNEKLIKSIYVPKDILQASFGDFSYESPGRALAFEHADQFVSTYEPGSSVKGLYLYGEFGVGKSYLLGAIANQLAEKEISSLIVYVPEFLREMKQSLGDQTLNSKLEAVKNAKILMLDDIGAEAMSSWTRDEILGSILQFRMHEQLPTFFTSNFDFSGLQHHLTYTQRGEEEKMKAARIMERIKYLSTPIKLDGPNRRHD